MHIVWFSWKDSLHPMAGGAEVVSSEIRKRLVKHGHTVTLITARYPKSSSHNTDSGIKTIRVGDRFSVYWHARRAYKELEVPADMVIDEMNTIPFFTPFYTKQTNNILLTYQLAREVWFYQMVFPLSLIGYLLEPVYLRLLSKRYGMVLTESNSTKKDLITFGFKSNTISVFPVGIETKPLTSIGKKTIRNQIVFLGSFRPMKRPLDAVKAFEHARDKNDALTLIMAGSTSGTYGKKVLKYIEQSRHSQYITVRGRISQTEKISLLRAADAILVTSTKEGWGLIATEANSQGTPAIAYDTDGLRDSVIHNKTGIIVPSGNFGAMGNAIISILSDQTRYKKFCVAALEHSRKYTFDTSYSVFVSAIGLQS